MMGCVSSTLLAHDDDFTTQFASSTTFAHHIVSLTSTTYGALLTLDSASDNSDSDSTNTKTNTNMATPEIINSWELMAGLDSNHLTSPNHSFRFPTTIITSSSSSSSSSDLSTKSNNDAIPAAAVISRNSYSLDDFKTICPPKGEHKVVIYTTTLRGVRKTYEACNAVRSVIESFGVAICERDISMDRGFRNELRELSSSSLFKGKGNHNNNGITIPPRLFINGRYIGGAEEVMTIFEDGGMEDLLRGFPKSNMAGQICDGCGGARFMPCFKCNGSCKMVMSVIVKQDQLVEDPKVQQQGMIRRRRRRIVVLRCSHCNENGLVICPICS